MIQIDKPFKGLIQTSFDLRFYIDQTEYGQKKGRSQNDNIIRNNSKIKGKKDNLSLTRVTKHLQSIKHGKRILN